MAHSQGTYVPIIRQLVKAGPVSMASIRLAVQGRVALTDADWRRQGNGQIAWQHRLQGAVRHLVRSGVLVRTGRCTYSRAEMHRPLFVTDAFCRMPVLQEPGA